jgi:hypothetical protein
MQMKKMYWVLGLMVSVFPSPLRAQNGNFIDFSLSEVISGLRSRVEALERAYPKGSFESHLPTIVFEADQYCTVNLWTSTAKALVTHQAVSGARVASGHLMGAEKSAYTCEGLKIHARGQVVSISFQAAISRLIQLQEDTHDGAPQVKLRAVFIPEVSQEFGSDPSDRGAANWNEYRSASDR